MTIEEGGDRNTICPYWRRFVRYRQYTLALCGAESTNEPPLLDNDLGPRSRRCILIPTNAAKTAFANPGILEVHPNYQHGFDVILASPYMGVEGIRYLEEHWDGEVMRFVKRHP